MRRRQVFCALACLAPALLASCSDDDPVKPEPARVTYELVLAFPNLDFVRPIDLQDPRDGTNRLFVAEQAGRIIVFENSPGRIEVVICDSGVFIALLCV